MDWKSAIRSPQSAIKNGVLCSALCALLAVAALLSACDTVEPVGEAQLVVEGFFDAGKPLPHIILRQTIPLAQPYISGSSAAVADAEVMVALGGETVTYASVPGEPGRYAPAGGPPERVPPGAALALQVHWQERVAYASSKVPPPIRIDSIQVRVPDEPVAAVLLDSLLLDPSRRDSLGLDSLSTGFQRGFIYPVEVDLWWSVEFAETGPDSAYWVRTYLKPVATESSEGFNFFLRPEQVQRERSILSDAFRRRSWTGVYAVPVVSKEDLMPEHRLRVSLLRSGQDYARFATSRDAPDRREPVSNVQGGLGIVAGISIDSLSVEVW